MRNHRFANWSRTGIAVVLVTAILVLAFPVIGADDCTFCLDKHMGVFDLAASSWRYIWPHTGTNRLALVTVTLTGPAAGEKLTVRWLPESGQEKTLDLTRSGNSVTVLAQQVRIDGGPAIGTYEVTFNLCGRFGN